MEKFSTKDISQYPGIWFHEVYNLNLNFEKIKGEYEKYEDEIK